MYKWSLLLLASAAVFQPIASFTERKLVDGRQQCCDHQPQLLHRDTRLSVYGAIDKVVSQEDRLNNRYAVPATSYEVRSAESKVSRVTENPGSRLVTSRTGRISQFYRQAADGSDFRGQSGTRSSWISNQKERNLRENRLTRSRDATARSANERRFRVSVDIRQEPRFTRETDNIHNNRAIRENRNTLQRAGNDVDRANIWNSRILRETLEQSVRDISRTRLPVDRSMMADENRRVVNDARIRKVNFNRHMIREMSYEKMSVRQTPEIRRFTNDHRQQTREDFRKEDRVEAVTDRRFAVFTVGGRQSLSYSRSARELRQNTYVDDRRTVRSVNRSFTRNFNGEGRQLLPKSLDSRSNPVLSSLETRTFLERRYVDETMNVRTKNIERHNRDMTNHERFKTQMTRIDERRNSLLDEQERKQIRRSTVERMEAKRSRRETRDISSARQGSVESLRFGRRDTRFDNRAETRNQRSFSPNQQDRRSSDRHVERNNSVRDGMTLTRQVRSVKDLRLERRDTRFNIRAEKRSNNYELESSLNEQRQENPRFTNRRMELSRREARERVTLARQARSVENLRFDRRDTRFANRAETSTRNQRRFSNINELERSLNEQRQENRRSTGRRMELSRHEARERVTLARQARSAENLRFDQRDTRFANRAETTTKNQRSFTNIYNVDIQRNSRNVQERQENGRSTERLMERSRHDARDGIPLTRQARSMENLRFDRKDTRFANRIETKNQRSSSDSDLGRSWNEQERRENIRFMDRQLERNRPQTFAKMTLARQVRSVENLRFDQRDTRFANRAETRNPRSSNNIRVVDVQRNSRNIQERQENRRSTERLTERRRNDVRDGIPLTRQARSIENLRFDHRDTRFANRIETRNQRSSSDSDLGRSWNEQERRENIRFMDRQLERNRPQTFAKMTLARQVRSVENLRFDQRDTRFANRAETRNPRSSNNIRVVDVQRNSRNIQERQENRRSTERLMERRRNDVRDGIPLTRQARSMDNLRFDHRDTRFANRIETRNQRSSSNFDLGRSWNEQERRENIRSSDRQSKQSRPQAYGTLARQAHSVENLKSERRDTRYANRADSRNQRTSSHSEERSELRLPAKLEIDVSRTRETPMSDDRVREIRNRQVRNARIADRSETRSRLALAEVARFRNEFASTKGTKQSFVLNWQHLFYTLQGIYLCGVIVTMMKENPSSHKTRSWWGLSTKAIKVD